MTETGDATGADRAGAHVANAAFLVDPARAGHGIGRALAGPVELPVLPRPL